MGIFSRPRDRRSTPRFPLLAVVMVLLIGLAQWSAPWTDHQLANMASCALAAVALLSIVIWWFRVTVDRAARRWIPLGVLALLLVIPAVIFEPVGVNGELVPQFRNRFAQTAAPLPSEPEPLRNATDAVMEAEGFNQFLGPDRDGRLAYRGFVINLAEHPPRRLWSQPIGRGLAGVAVVPIALDVTNSDQAETDEPESSEPGGNAMDEARAWVCVTMEQRENEEWVTCYDLGTGVLRWYHAAAGYHSHPLGDVGPRSTPTVDETGHVYALGATGLLRCINGVDGALIWQANLLALAGLDQETSESTVMWGRSASPLIVDDMVVVPLGGSADGKQGVKSLVALEKQTGKIRWTGGEDQISYASPILTRIAGVQQIVSVNEATVSACDPETGNVLWTSPWSGSSSGAANCSNPVPYGPDQILLSKGYGGGAEMLRVGREGDRWATERVWGSQRVLKTKFTNVLIDSHYGYALSDGTLQCVDLRDGEQAWRQPRGDRFGHGQVLIVEDVLLATTEEGQVALVELTSEHYRELGRFQAVAGKTWNPPSVVGNKIIVRNGAEMAVWELDRKNAEEK